MRCFFSVLNKLDLFIPPLCPKNSSLGQLSLLLFITRWMVSFALKIPLWYQPWIDFAAHLAQYPDYLSSWAKAELCVISQDPSTALLELGGNHECLKLGQRVLEKLSELCEIYPGNTNVYEGVKMKNHRFSLKLDDFCLSNIMVRLTKTFLSILRQTSVFLPASDRQRIWKSYFPHWFRGCNYRSCLELCHDTQLDSTLQFWWIVLQRFSQWCKGGVMQAVRGAYAPPRSWWRMMAGIY